MRKKRPFLLLELLIALALLSLFALPIIRQPFNLLREEIADLERIELERISETLFAEIKKKFLAGEISWKQVLAAQKEILFDHKSIIVRLDNDSAHVFKVKYYLSIKNQTEAAEPQQACLVQIGIALFPEPKGKHPTSFDFQHYLFVEKAQKKVV